MTWTAARTRFTSGLVVVVVCLVGVVLAGGGQRRSTVDPGWAAIDGWQSAAPSTGLMSDRAVAPPGEVAPLSASSASGRAGVSNPSSGPSGRPRGVGVVVVDGGGRQEVGAAGAGVAVVAPVIDSPGPSTSTPPTSSPLAGWGEPPAPAIDPRRFTEAHWQGLEVIPNSPLMAQTLGLPVGRAGVIVDDVTLPADLQGFVAGDLVTAVGGTPTPDLLSFIGATEAVRDQSTATVGLVRKGEPLVLELRALATRLGTANGETPSMIPPGARMPHPYRGPCTNCHRIGTTGTLPADQGDRLTLTAPAIAAGSARPHRDRGPCRACHQILP